MAPRKIQHTLTYDSLEDFAATAKRHHDAGTGHDDLYKSFNGVDTFEEAYALSQFGWQDAEVEALRLVDSAIETVEADHEMDGFRASWEMSGGEVDVGAYLSGEPECMINYHLVQTPKSGRVITLCASMVVSSAISTSVIKRRGYGIAALAFALGRMGFAVELWADWTCTSTSYYQKMPGVIVQRVLVKGLNDELDPAKIMFAYAHPAMLRAIGFNAAHEFPENIRTGFGIPGGYGIPDSPIEDLPEGTIYLPEVCSSHDVPDAADLLLTHMRALGIIPGEGE